MWLRGYILPGDDDVGVCFIILIKWVRSEGVARSLSWAWYGVVAGHYAAGLERGIWALQVLSYGRSST